MPLRSTVSQAAITVRSDRAINEIIKANWTIPSPSVNEVGFGEFWELSDSNSTIMAWEIPVNMVMDGLQGKYYNHTCKNQIDIMVKNPENIGYPPDLEKMVFHCQDIITDHIIAGIRDYGYYSMILTGRQYIRNPTIADKALCALFVDVNVRCVQT